MKHWFTYWKRSRNEVDSEALRRMIEGELPLDRHAEILEKTRQSEPWNQEYRRVRKTLGTLQNLPVYNPPDRVWQAVRAQIRKEQPRPRWMVRLIPDTPWLAPVRLIPVVLATAIICMAVYTGSVSDPGYRLVAVEDNDLFAMEADTYVAHHNLLGEPSITQESLAALYTYGWTE